MTRLLIIIPAEILDVVRTVATAAFGEHALNEFTVALSGNGAEPASHYWIAGQFDDDGVAKVNALAGQFPTAEVLAYDLKANPGAPFERMATLGLKPITSGGLPI